MGDYTYRLSLWIEHPDADLSDVPQRLGITPDRLWKKGDIRVAPNGRVIGGFHNRSYCSFQFGRDYETNLPEGLRKALDTLKPHEKYLRELRERGGALNFFIGWFSDHNSRDIIGWDILRDMAQLGLSLDLDIYGPDSGAVSGEERS